MDYNHDADMIKFKTCQELGDESDDDIEHLQLDALKHAQTMLQTVLMSPKKKPKNSQANGLTFTSLDQFNLAEPILEETSNYTE